MLCRAEPPPPAIPAARAATGRSRTAERARSAPPASRTTPPCPEPPLQDWLLQNPQTTKPARRPADLRQESVNAATTGKRYEATLRGFEAWLWTQEISFPEMLARPAEEIDNLLVDYLQVCYDAGLPKSTSGTLISAIQDRRPALKRHLPAAWRAHGAWSTLEPGESRTPWPWDLALAVIWSALLCNRWDLAIFILISFDGLLRPGETCNLLRSDLRLPSDFTFGNKDVVILTIRVPKTRRRAARVQHVLLRNQRSVRLLQAFAKHKPAGQALFPPYPHVQRHIYMYLQRLGLPPGLYTLGGLRGGGATHRYINEEDTLRIMRMGRWTAVRTLEHYLQEATCLLSTTSWNSTAHASVKSAATNAVSFLLKF